MGPSFDEQRKKIADWLKKAENELGELTVQDDIQIEIKKVRKQILEKPRA